MPMTALVETLRTQHRAILEVAARVDDAIAKRDGGAARRHLDELTTALMAHLELEDRSLYPEMVRLAEAQGAPARAATAQIFASNMARISKAVEDFFGRHPASRDLDLVRLEADWRFVRKLLADRISSEETALYPLFVQLQRAG